MSPFTSWAPASMPGRNAELLNSGDLEMTKTAITSPEFAPPAARTANVASPIRVPVALAVASIDPVGLYSAHDRPANFLDSC